MNNYDLAEMPIVKTETIEEYHKRLGVVYDPIQAKKDFALNDMDVEDCFYRQMGYYPQ